MNAVVQSEADALPDDIRARLFRYAGVIEDEGLNALPAGWVKPLGDKLWELRLTGRDGIARAIYVTATKKTEKTPPKELRIARLRAKEV